MAIVSGIYVILHKKSGKIYLGQSQNIHKRWGEHRRDLIRNAHHNPRLQNAWNKYGAKEFKFQILEYCSVDQLNEREQHYLDIYKRKDICYNIADFADSPFRGKKHSPSARQKLSDINTGKTHSDVSRQKMSDWRKGRPKSEDHRRKIGAAHKGKPKKETSIQKTGEANRRNYIFTSPEGIEFEVRGLARFSIEKGLSPTRMSKVACGKQSSYKGWKCRRI